MGVARFMGEGFYVERYLQELLSSICVLKANFIL
jgi:hypothetical protein